MVHHSPSTSVSAALMMPVWRLISEMVGDVLDRLGSSMKTTEASFLVVVEDGGPSPGVDPPPSFFSSSSSSSSFFSVFATAGDDDPCFRGALLLPSSSRNCETSAESRFASSFIVLRTMAAQLLASVAVEVTPRASDHAHDSLALRAGNVTPARAQVMYVRLRKRARRSPLIWLMRRSQEGRRMGTISRRQNYD